MTIILEDLCSDADMEVVTITAHIFGQLVEHGMTFIADKSLSDNLSGYLWFMFVKVTLHILGVLHDRNSHLQECSVAAWSVFASYCLFYCLEFRYYTYIYLQPPWDHNSMSLHAYMEVSCICIRKHLFMMSG